MFDVESGEKPDLFARQLASGFSNFNPARYLN